MRCFKAMPMLLVLAAGGCQTADPAMNVDTHLVGSDFCEIQKSKLTWVPQDTRETIHGIRQFNAKWDARCSRAGT
jgi:hypothetical protein